MDLPADLMTLRGLGGSSISAGGFTDTSDWGIAFGAGLVRGLDVSGSSGGGGGASKGSSTIVTFFFRGARSLTPDGRPLFFASGAAGSTIGAGGSSFSATMSTIGSTIASAILIYCNIFTTIDEQFKNVL
jgi:hypothetical protein